MQLRLCAFGRPCARVCSPSYGGSGKQSYHGRCHQRARQVPVAKPPQTRDDISQVVIFDVGPRGIQTVRCLSSEVADCLRSLASCGANG